MYTLSTTIFSYPFDTLIVQTAKSFILREQTDRMCIVQYLNYYTRSRFVWRASGFFRSGISDNQKSYYN